MIGWLSSKTKFLSNVEALIRGARDPTTNFLTATILIQVYATGIGIASGAEIKSAIIAGYMKAKWWVCERQILIIYLLKIAFRITV